MTPGKRPASSAPRRRRQAMRPAKLLTKAEKVATRPQRNMRPPRYRAGFILLMIMFDCKSISIYHPTVVLRSAYGSLKDLWYGQHVTRTFWCRATHNVGDEQDGDCNLKLISPRVHTKVLFHPVQACVTNIDYRIVKWCPHFRVSYIPRSIKFIR